MCNNDKTAHKEIVHTKKQQHFFALIPIPFYFYLNSTLNPSLSTDHTKGSNNNNLPSFAFIFHNHNTTVFIKRDSSCKKYVFC